MGLPKKIELNLTLHDRQTDCFYSKATEILYGGAAGGGKSHLMRIAAIIWSIQIPGLQVYLFRRVRDDLIKNHMEGPQGFRAILAGYEQAGLVQIIEDEIRFWNGSKIYLCHCQYDKDRFKYQGAEIHVLLIDELTHFSETVYRFLRNRVRCVGVNIPPEWEGCFPRILCGANPGNVGHIFVKSTFIDGVEPYEIREMPAVDGGMNRQYIPARLEDNPSMTDNDPGYEKRLEGLGSESLVKAMRWGDWNIVDGAYFDCWDSDKHVVRPFEIPRDWLRFRSFDWGSAKPFSVGWYAVAQEPINGLPRGCLIKYREWYGMKPGQPNVGLKLTTEAVADGILEREGVGETIAYSVADPAIFTSDGGPSHAERFANKGVYFKRADNKRSGRDGPIGGWDMMRHRLIGDGDGPMLVFFSICHDSIRTIPALQHDEAKPEDLDTKMEDHAGDEGRYACMSRPWLPPAIINNKKPKDRWDVEDDTPRSWKTV